MNIQGELTYILKSWRMKSQEYTDICIHTWKENQDQVQPYLG